MVNRGFETGHGSMKYAFIYTFSGDMASSRCCDVTKYECHGCMDIWMMNMGICKSAVKVSYLARKSQMSEKSRWLFLTAYMSDPL